MDSYQTGMLVDPTYASRRNGVVLESNFGIVDGDRISREDRDGDGKWALVTVDLDRLTEPAKRGEDWRSRFEHNANAIYWSDGAVLKSDTVREDGSPDRGRALHYRGAVHPGPYRVRVSDPGRSVAVSLDGTNWKRYEGGSEIDLGTRELDDGVVEFWLDACYRDPMSVGPAYFDYVRLSPAKDAAGRGRALATRCADAAGPGSRLGRGEDGGHHGPCAAICRVRQAGRSDAGCRFPAASWPGRIRWRSKRRRGSASPARHVRSPPGPTAA